jgi:hypothetical protein
MIGRSVNPRASDPNSESTRPRLRTFWIRRVAAVQGCPCPVA